MNSYALHTRKVNGVQTHSIIVNAKDCNFGNAWANTLYSSGFVKITLDSCYVGIANGAAVHFDAQACTQPGLEAELHLVNGTEIDNWVVGTETWFDVYGAAPVVGPLKDGLEQFVRGYSGNTRKIKGTRPNGDSTLNFAILVKTIGDQWTETYDDVGHGQLILTVDGSSEFFTANLIPENSANAQGSPIGVEYAKIPVPGGAIPGLKYMEGYIQIVDADAEV